MPNIVSLGAGNASGRRFNIKNRDEILTDQEPEWLVEGLYPQDSLVEVFGNPDACKTFFALDVACSVATGSPLLGNCHVPLTGDVVYVYGEGGRGFAKRLRAWEVDHGCEAVRFFGIAEPVDMLSDEPELLIADIRVAGVNPVLIVLDTLARCFGEGDENSTQDMNGFVSGCDRLRRAFARCTVLVVHHCGWEGTRGRGARAWEGALDTATRMERTAGGLVSLSVTKQKDFAQPEHGMTLELVDVAGTGSAILRLADRAKVKAARDSNDERVLRELREAGDKGLSVKEMEQRTGINQNTLRTVRQRLKQKGLAEDRKRRWFALSLPVVAPAIEAQVAR